MKKKCKIEKKNKFSKKTFYSLHSMILFWVSVTPLLACYRSFALLCCFLGCWNCLDISAFCCDNSLCKNISRIRKHLRIKNGKTNKTSKNPLVWKILFNLLWNNYVYLEQKWETRCSFWKFACQLYLENFLFVRSNTEKINLKTWLS